MASRATDSKEIKLDGSPRFVTEYDLDALSERIKLDISSSALSQGVQIKHMSLDTCRYDMSSSALAAILLLKRSQKAAKMLEAYCPICEELMLATSTPSARAPCSHELRPDGSFCGFTACARCWQALHIKKCPGSSCSSDLKEVPPVNAFLAKKIQGLEAQCGRKGCTSAGLTIGSAWTRHRDHECSKRPVFCSDCKKNMTHDQLLSHQLDTCPERKQTCATCEDQVVLARHACPNQVLPCALCTMKIRRADVMAHFETSCPRRMVSCRYGCGLVTASDMEAHQMDKIKEHLDWATKKLDERGDSKSDSPLGQDASDLVRHLIKTQACSSITHYLDSSEYDKPSAWAKLFLPRVTRLLYSLPDEIRTRLEALKVYHLPGKITDMLLEQPRVQRVILLESTAAMAMRIEQCVHVLLGGARSESSSHGSGPSFEDYLSPLPEMEAGATVMEEVD